MDEETQLYADGEDALLELLDAGAVRSGLVAGRPLQQASSMAEAFDSVAATQAYPDMGAGAALPGWGAQRSYPNDDDDLVTATQFYSDSLAEAAGAWMPPPPVPKFCPPPTGGLSPAGAARGAAAARGASSPGVGCADSGGDLLCTQLYVEDGDCGWARGNTDMGGRAQPSPLRCPRAPAGVAAGPFASPRGPPAGMWEDSLPATQMYAESPGVASAPIHARTVSPYGASADAKRQPNATAPSPLLAPLGGADARASTLDSPPSTQLVTDFPGQPPAQVSPQSTQAYAAEATPRNPPPRGSAGQSPQSTQAYAAETTPRNPPRGSAGQSTEPGTLANTQAYTGTPSHRLEAAGRRPVLEGSPVNTQLYADTPQRLPGGADARSAKRDSPASTEPRANTPNESPKQAFRSSKGTPRSARASLKAGLASPDLAATQLYDDGVGERSFCDKVRDARKMDPQPLSPTESIHSVSSPEPAAKKRGCGDSARKAPREEPAVAETQWYGGPEIAREEVLLVADTQAYCEGPEDEFGAPLAAGRVSSVSTCSGSSSSSCGRSSGGSRSSGSGWGLEKPAAAQVDDPMGATQVYEDGPGCGFGVAKAGSPFAAGPQRKEDADDEDDDADRTLEKPLAPLTGGSELMLEATQLYGNDFTEFGANSTSPAKRSEGGGVGGACAAAAARNEDSLLEATQFYGGDLCEALLASPEPAGEQRPAGGQTPSTEGRPPAGDPGDAAELVEATQFYCGGFQEVRSPVAAPAAAARGMDCLEATQLYDDGADVLCATQLYTDLGSPSVQRVAESPRGSPRAQQASSGHKEAAVAASPLLESDGKQPGAAASSSPGKAGERRRWSRGCFEPSSPGVADEAPAALAAAQQSRGGEEAAPRPPAPADALRPAAAEEAQAMPPPRCKRSPRGGATPKTPTASAVKPIATPARSPMKIGQASGQPVSAQEFATPSASTPLLELFPQPGSSSRGGRVALAAHELTPKGPAAATPQQPAAAAAAAPQKPLAVAVAKEEAEASQLPPLQFAQSQVFSWPLTQADAAPAEAPAEAAPEVALPPKKRRLVGKQAPPVPNPFAAPATATSGAASPAGAAAAAAAAAVAAAATAAAAEGRASGRARRGSAKAKARSTRGSRSKALPDDDDSDGPVGRRTPGSGRKRGAASMTSPPRAPAAAAAAAAAAPARKASKLQQACRPPCFTATGLDLGPKFRRAAEGKLGARLLDEWSQEVTHLLSDTFRRTTKLMCAICTGARILVPGYLEACRQAGQLVDEERFVLRDTVCEAAFAKKHGLPGYSLDAALRRARECGPMLAGYAVYCEQSVPGRQDLRVLVEAAGGVWLRRAGEHAGLRRTLHIGKEYDAELLREAACTQVLRFDVYRL